MDLSVVLIVIGSVGLFLGLFAGIWFLVTRMLRSMAGMTKELDVDTGILVRESAWGSGSVNGVSARGCLKVAEYENGWVVRFARVFGGGKIWLSRQRVRSGATEKGDLFRPRYRMIFSGADRIRLIGHLAAFVKQSPSSDNENGMSEGQG